jgi:hypothetical protein
MRINLDYSRVEIAVAARQWPVKLYFKVMQKGYNETDAVRSARKYIGVCQIYE